MISSDSLCVLNVSTDNYGKSYYFRGTKVTAIL